MQRAMVSLSKMGAVIASSVLQSVLSSRSSFEVRRWLRLADEGAFEVSMGTLGTATQIRTVVRKSATSGDEAKRTMMEKAG